LLSPLQDFYNFSETGSKSIGAPLRFFFALPGVKIFLSRKDRRKFRKQSRERFMRKSVVINNLRGYNNLYADL
jgi:hypothetical protein